MFFFTKIPTPLFNSPYLDKILGSVLPFDNQERIVELEMIALKGTILRITKKITDTIIQVEYDEYLVSKPLYTDTRCGAFVCEKSTTPRLIPPVSEVIDKMIQCVGVPYLWGGNYCRGIDLWKEFYPPKRKLSFKEETFWTFKGVDCSGLLYEACNGCILRNTSDLMNYGFQVCLDDIKPLDIILYKGHVIIYIGNRKVIESCLAWSEVRINNLDYRLSLIKKPFIVRRFHPDALKK
mgnify:CR=1 FL=1